MIGRILRLSAVTTKGMRQRYARLLPGLAAVLLLAGCSSFGDWSCDCSLNHVLERCRQACPEPCIADAREALLWAAQHEKAGSEECVDLYFLAASLSHNDACLSSPHDAPLETKNLYHQSLAGFIRTSQQFCRYDPVQGIRVYANGRPVTVPICQQGFSWQPHDFSRMVIADRFVRSDLKAQFYGAGIGVPLVVVREKDTPERFLASRSHFPATANLKRRSPDTCDCEPAWVLELANPLRIGCTRFNGQSVQIARDLSSATRYVLGRQERTYLRDFLRPGVSTAEPKLMMFEPYQPGKIPIVFIHGLLSDPMTWAELFESIHVDPEFQDRYQFWAFQYPTGAAFLRSAANLRRELATLVMRVDPDGTDPALSQMVLIGHSMGGLVAKLQITSSEDRLWRAFANRPMESLQLTENMRTQFQELFYFEPSPHIRRVVYIGTPHNGSSVADRCIGRLGSYLVRIPDNEKQQYEAFLAANPGVVHSFASRRIPTSVDMLEPENPILHAMARLPMSPCVTTHSIIGTGGYSLCREPSDGVVPVASAQIPCVESELFVEQSHEHLHHDPKTIQEVMRILRWHLQCGEAVSEACCE